MDYEVDIAGKLIDTVIGAHLWPTGSKVHSKTVFELQDWVASNLRLNDIGTYRLGQRVFETYRCKPFGSAEPRR